MCEDLQGQFLRVFCDLIGSGKASNRDKFGSQV